MRRNRETKSRTQKQQSHGMKEHNRIENTSVMFVDVKPLPARLFKPILNDVDML